MEILREEIINYLLQEYGFNPEVNCEPEHSEYFSWIPVFNSEFYNFKPVPTFFYKGNNQLLEIDKEYSFVTENRFQFKELDYQKYQVRALSTTLHEMTHKWFNYYIDENLYTGWWHGKPFRDLMKSFGIKCDEQGNHLAITDPFRKLVREADLRDYRQFNLK